MTTHRQTTRRQILQWMGGTAAASMLPASMLPASALAQQDTEPLKAIAARKGMRFGNAMGFRHFADANYRALMARECNAFVAENETKWQALQPSPGPHQFGQADKMIAWARENGMAVRGHTLVWQDTKWLPKWVNQHDFGAAPAKEAERLLRAHISTVCQHFGQTIMSYDVVNEAVDPKDGGYRKNVLNTHLGGAVEQIDLAFRLAREHAPHAQLVYNDYMRGDAGSARHRAGVLKLLEALKKKGTPVHGLGLQSHIGSWDEMAGHQATEWRKFLDEASAMGLDLLITEFDVNDRKLPGDIAKRDAGVASLAKDYLDLTLSYPNLRDFLLWGMADHVNWLQTWDEAPRTDGLPMRPAPFDAKLQPKPLRDAIASSMRAMPTRSKEAKRS